MENSVNKRLSIQNEVLNWLEDFSKVLENRANATTLQINELLDKTRFVEQDLKNTSNSFRTLAYLRFTENRISEDNELIDRMKEESRNSAVGVPAQSYEADILPRYREALSLGLSSYRNHLQKINGSSLMGSGFKVGSARGPLPHIIGSEEYNHDNSCGLMNDDFILETAPFDFKSETGPNWKHMNAGGSGSHPMLNAELFGSAHGPSEKDGEPLVSAALDFKAMLEAALLSPYKFYDEESSSLPDAVSGSIEHMHEELDHVQSMTSTSATVASSQHLAPSNENNLPLTKGNLTFPRDSDIDAHKLCSALLSESLFDPEEETSFLNQKELAHGPDPGAEPCSFECADSESRFSTVVSVSREWDSSLSQPTLSSSHDLDLSSGRETSNNTFPAEDVVAKESHDIGGLLNRQPQAAMESSCNLDEGETSIMHLAAGTVADDSIQE